MKNQVYIWILYFQGATILFTVEVRSVRVAHVTSCPCLHPVQGGHEWFRVRQPCKPPCLSHLWCWWHSGWTRLERPTHLSCFVVVVVVYKMDDPEDKMKCWENRGNLSIVIVSIVLTSGRSWVVINWKSQGDLLEPWKCSMIYMTYISKHILTYKQDLCILLYVIYNQKKKKWRKGSRVPIKGRLERKLSYGAGIWPSLSNTL